LRRKLFEISDATIRAQALICGSLSRGESNGERTMFCARISMSNASANRDQSL
jgi:hypothetical protein